MKKILGIRNINNKIINIYIINNKIYLNKPENTNEDEFQNIILDKDIYVSYGWIDSHVHCDKENKLYGSEIDEIGFHQGVTTVIDAGSVGIDDISRMYDYSKKAITNLKIILNISKKGIYKQSELSNLNDISINFNEKKFKNFIVGYKARMSSSVTLESGTKALEIFNQIRDEQNIKLPLMVHIGNEPPVFGDIFPKLRKNDVITHIFNYKNYSIFDKNYEITESLNMAIEKGIKFDVGHGSESFNLECAKNAFKNNFRMDTISSDIYSSNKKNGLVGSLANVMNKFKKIGYEWSEIIEKVTYEPSHIWNLNNMGKIENGYYANLTFFKIIKDNNSIEKIVPISCIVNGEYYEVKDD